MRALAFRRQHDAGGVLVETVDDSRPHLAANAGQPIAAMRDQRVHKRAVGLAGARMDDHAGGLVDDDQVGILIQNVQRDVLCDRTGVAHRRQAQHIGRAGPDRGRRVARWTAILGHRAIKDQRLDAGARQRLGRGETRGKEPVEPVGRRVLGNGDGQIFGHGIACHRIACHCIACHGIAGHWPAG